MSTKGKFGYIFIAPITPIHVNDCYVVGDLKDLDETIALLEEKNLKGKLEKDTRDYLSCDIKFNKKKGTVWILGQPHHLIKKI